MRRPSKNKALKSRRATASCSRCDRPRRSITMASKLSRRDLLRGSSALIVGTAFAEPVRAAAPPAEAITPALIEAAKKEGKCAFYTAMDLTLAERLGKSFEAKYGIPVRVERSGAERIFTRIAQE